MNLKEILEQIDIEYWLDKEGIQHRQTVGSSGEQLNLKICPVCGGSKWKVYVNAHTGLGNCFSGSCETTFNKYSLVKHHLSDLSKTNFMMYLTQTASECGWRPKRLVVYDNDDSDLTIPESIELPFGKKNLKYLVNRGITNQITKHFQLRFCKTGYFAYIKDGEYRFQDYTDRIIIPIFDLDKKLVSFQGRDTTGLSEKKYIFPPGFSTTGKILYNGHNAVRSKRIVINEGVFDVMACKMALDKEVSLRDVTPVGSFGKHLSLKVDGQVDELLKLKKLGMKHVTIMWDGERSAILAAINTGLKLLERGVKCSVAILPEGKDPNEVDYLEVIKAYQEATLITKMSAAKLMIKYNK